jgi:hypothetical protein
LLDCIEWFLCLIEQLETGAEVSLPEWEKQYEKAGRAGNTLCDAGAVPEDVTPIKIIAAFPEPPNPVAGWQKQYDVDRARVKKSPLSDLARQLNAIRIQAETCPMTLLMPTATNTEQDEENGRIGFPIPPHLNGRDREVLKVLLDGEAFDSDHLMRTADIALKAAGKAADPNQYKEVIVKLKTLGYVETKEGRGGGCWLTAPGRQRAEKL